MTYCTHDLILFLKWVCFTGLDGSFKMLERSRSKLLRSNLREVMFGTLTSDCFKIEEGDCLIWCHSVQVRL